jgi:carotenoid cleavage dioxygenase-like enzyme
MVNLLPIAGQLWITIDTFAWGRIDPITLETIQDAHVNLSHVGSFTLNAHPPCDPVTKQCFVQHPCPGSWQAPWTDQACFSELLPQTNSPTMQIREVGRVTLKKKKTIQHSHSPCLTPHYLVAHIDHFRPRADVLSNENTGMLKELHQFEDNEWMVTSRVDGTSRVLQSDFAFVNNHFWNCYEDDDAGGIVVETVGVTRDYLDYYFQKNLSQPITPWAQMFLQPKRCVVPYTGTAITCTPLLQETVYFDYPTYNPLVKMADYQYFYAIAAKTQKSRWLDSIIKVDRQKGIVANTWSAPGIYVTEAEFIPVEPTSDAAAPAEDDGVLFSILYNETSDDSSVALFDAQSLTLLAQYSLQGVVPFHAHGLICHKGRCYPNP